jgi:hypothetical protein
MLSEFFIGDTWATNSAADTPLRVLQVLAAAAAAAGVLGAVAWWRQAAPAQRRALGYLLSFTALGLLVLVLLSLQTSLLERRYASVFWGPAAVAAGVGLSAVPGRWLRRMCAAGLLACSAGFMVVQHHGEVADVRALAPRAGAHDLIDAEPGEYLLLLWYADQGSLARTHIVADHVPWWWGTAAFPPGGVADSVSADVAANHGTIWVIREHDFGPPPLPPGYGLRDTRRVGRVYLDRYSERD